MTFVVGLFLNGTEMPLDFNYISPPLPNFVNGHKDPTSQRFLVEAILSSNSFDLTHRLGTMPKPKCDHACYSSYRSYVRIDAIVSPCHPKTSLPAT